MTIATLAQEGVARFVVSCSLVIPSQLHKMPGHGDWELVFHTSPNNGCDLGMRMAVYAYDNSAFTFRAALFVRCDGKLSYASFGNTTEWHGSWKELDDGRGVATFNCKGDVTKMKACTLIRGSDGGFFGVDQKNDEIDLKLIFECRYCHSCHCWHKM